jgi:hypothetical protein
MVGTHDTDTDNAKTKIRHGKRPRSPNPRIL